MMLAVNDIKRTFVTWLVTMPLGFKCNWEDHMVVYPEGTVRLYLYTAANEYCITGTIKNYLGATVSARMKSPGEDWVRGSDLHDGPFNAETWERIMHAIVMHEMIPVVRPVALQDRFRKPHKVAEVGGIINAANSPDQRNPNEQGYSAAVSGE